MSKGVQITLATLAVFAGLGWFAASQTQGQGTFQMELARYRRVPTSIQEGIVADRKQGELVGAK